MPYFLDRSGQRVFVKPEEAAEAWQSGQYGLSPKVGLLPSGRVAIVGPKGQQRTIPTESLGQAFKMGWRMEEEAETTEREYGDKDVRAFAAGAARGATLGLSDLVMTKTGLVDPETLKKLEEANPVSSGVGEVVGAVGSAFIPAGGQVGVATKLLRGVTAPSRAVAGAGARIAGGVEGEILKYLTQKGASKALVKAGELAAGEAATTPIAKAALAKATAFAAAGAVEGSLYGVADAVNEKVLGDPRALSEILAADIGPTVLASGMAGGLFGGAGALAGGGLKKLTGIAAEKLGQEATIAERLESFAQRKATKGLHSTPSKMGEVEEKGLIEEVGRDLLAKHEVLGGKQVAAGSVKDTLKNIVTVRGDAGKRMSAALGKLDDMTKEAAVHGEEIAARLRGELLQGIADQPGYNAERALISKFAKEFEKIGGMGLVRANAIKGKIQKQVERLFGKEVVSPANEFRKRIAGVVRDEVDSTARKVAEANGASDVLQEFMEAKRLYRTMSEARTLAKSGVKRIEGNRTVSLTDYLSGIGGGVVGVASGSFVPVVGMVGAPMLNKLARERGNLFLAKAADRAAKLRILQQRVEISTDRVNSVIDRFVGSSAGTLTLGSSKVLSSLTGKESRAEAARDFAEQMHAAMGNPERLVNNISASLVGLDSDAPEIAAALSQKVAEIVASIQAHSPKPPQDSLLQPWASEWEIDDATASKFASTVAAHVDPLGTIEEILAGAADPQAISILRQHYPALLEAFTPRLLEAISLSKKKLTWQNKLALATLLDVPADPLLSPGGIRRSQQAYAPPPAKGRGPSGVRLTGLGELSGAKSMFQTSSQRVESLGGNS